MSFFSISIRLFALLVVPAFFVAVPFVARAEVSIGPYRVSLSPTGAQHPGTSYTVSGYVRNSGSDDFTGTVYYQWYYSTDGGGSWSDWSGVQSFTSLDAKKNINVGRSGAVGAADGNTYSFRLCVNTSPFVGGGCSSAGSITPTARVTLYTLSVSKSGSGFVSGTGISCGSDCSESLQQGTSVSLSASPSSGYTFSGWSGCDSVSGSSCSLSMGSARSVTANFTQLIASASLSASSPVSYQGGTYLQWSSSNTSSCTLTNFGSVPTSNSGTGYWSGNLTSDKTFTLSCTPISGAGGTPNSSVTISVKPSSPSVSASTSSCGGNISLSYASASLASSYRLYRDSGSGWSQIASASTVSGLPSSQSGLSSGMSYRYQLKASNGAGSSWSGVSTAAASASCFDYSLGNSGNLSITQGQSGGNTITATLTNGSSQSVTLSASGLPAGVSTSFNPSSVSPTTAGATSVLTLSVSGSASPGSYPITVSGSSLGKTTGFTLSVSQPTLSVSTNGSGSISCNGSPCASSYPSGTSITLTVSPAEGFAFSGWSGTCSGTGLCSFTMNRDRSATANFTLQSSSGGGYAQTSHVICHPSFGDCGQCGVPPYNKVSCPIPAHLSLSSPVQGATYAPGQSYQLSGRFTRSFGTYTVKVVGGGSSQTFGSNLGTNGNPAFSFGPLTMPTGAGTQRIMLEIDWFAGHSGWRESSAGNLDVTVAVPLPPPTCRLSYQCEVDRKVSAIPYHKSNTLTWSAVTGASGYRVYRSKWDSQHFAKVAEITDPAQTIWVDGPYTQSSQYLAFDAYYKVSAYNAAGESPMCPTLFQEGYADACPSGQYPDLSCPAALSVTGTTFGDGFKSGQPLTLSGGAIKNDFKKTTVSPINMLYQVSTDNGATYRDIAGSAVSVTGGLTIGESKPFASYQYATSPITSGSDQTLYFRAKVDHDNRVTPEASEDNNFCPAASAKLKVEQPNLTANAPVLTDQCGNTGSVLLAGKTTITGAVVNRGSAPSSGSFRNNYQIAVENGAFADWVEKPLVGVGELAAGGTRAVASFPALGDTPWVTTADGKRWRFRLAADSQSEVSETSETDNLSGATEARFVDFTAALAADKSALRQKESVRLTPRVSGSATGAISYSGQNCGGGGATPSAIDATTGAFSCAYTNAGSYTASVSVKRAPGTGAGSTNACVSKTASVASPVKVAEAAPNAPTLHASPAYCGGTVKLEFTAPTGGGPVASYELLREPAPATGNPKPFTTRPPAPPPDQGRGAPRGLNG